MLKPSQNWQPCFVDPWRGVAHFDGLTIEADPITSHRQDLVLPCIEDEQVYFCRMLKALLPSDEDRVGRHAVDLGMGSGVLSLYAASLGMRVTGIDICDRAQHFASYNLSKNRQVFIDSIDERVKFEPFDWNDPTQLQPLKGQADYVLVNAPFSPCRDGHHLTRCVSGGVLGQDAFLETLPIAYSLLKEQGRVYAIQLLLTDDQGKPKNDLFNVTGSEVDRWSSVRVFTAMESIPVREFLDDQYRSDSNAASSVASETYSNDYFCLAFIELTKDRDARKREVELVKPASNPLAPLPNWTWPARILMHRLTSENHLRFPQITHEPGNGPIDDAAEAKAHLWMSAIALFLQRTNPDSAFRPPTGDSLPDEVSKVLTQTQVQIDHWIRHNDLLRGPSNPDGFDCLMVEAVPWHFATSRLRLRTETAIWAGTANGGDEMPVSRALNRVLLEISRFVKEDRSIFLHPEHLRKNNAQAWQQAVCFQRSECEDDTQEPTQLPVLKLNPPAIRHGHVSCSSHLHELKKFEMRIENPSTATFESCLRRALRAYTGIMRVEGLLSGGSSQCYFISLPMPLLKPKSSHAESGIVYVYAWCAKPWSTSHECQVADLARLASFLYEERYSESTRSQLDLSLRQAMLVSAAHETKKLIDLIEPGISKPFAQLVKDYLQLQLEQTLGPTFAKFCHLLDSHVDLRATLSELSALAYVFEKLRHKNEYDPETLNVEQISAWREEASSTISIVTETDCVMDTSVKQLHFAAAFIAGLRNTIAHCSKRGNDARAINITAVAGCIQIINSYTNSNNGDEDKEPMRVKREQGVPGTESVIKYHERQLFIDNPDYQSRSGIKKLSCEELGKSMFRHTWETDIVVPRADNEKMA
ncbi:50S ribosomal protein L11 methyltransferase [Zoogloea sp.]|uniref:50S ribosomal protein L11 methyltransferase n=1 Tax=Zoogloea sp. TaxID=49181 RepID=UPI00260E3EF5|nr:50S ribosomal protein L11 methyltransferase [Zoogloea sp.]